MKTYNWEGICNEDRIPAISKVESLVNSFAYILDFHRFSDLSLEMTIGIEEWRVEALFIEMSKMMDMSGSKPEPGESKTECMIYLNIRFSKGKGDLKTEVPDFPG